MTDQNKEPRWSVTYAVHLDDKNGKTWGTLRYDSAAYASAAKVVADLSEVVRLVHDGNTKGVEANLIFLSNEYLHPDSDFGCFAGVKAFQFSVIDLWENTNNDD